jgi:hypothetical protein
MAAQHHRAAPHAMVHWWVAVVHYRSGMCRAAYERQQGMYPAGEEVRPPARSPTDPALTYIHMTRPVHRLFLLRLTLPLTDWQASAVQSLRVLSLCWRMQLARALDMHAHLAGEAARLLGASSRITPPLAR